MPLKKSDLYASLWASCNELRGGMDASQYKDYVLFMLFIKYVSDKYADSDAFSPSVVIPKGASFKDMVKLKNKPNIGEKINTQIIQALVNANDRFSIADFPSFNDPAKLGDGNAMVETISNLIAIFENPALDFSNNRAEQDDILGDAYEYLMKNFAYESGKSKGQFYTPSEVSRVIAKVVGISPENSKASTTVYDPTCGSGSLLLKVAVESGKSITLEGQEKDIMTAGLARINMILHDFPTSNIVQGNTLADPKFKKGKLLRTYDYVVANPPFSDKAWMKDVKPADDLYKRFIWGVPPKKQGDYAYLLHIISSMNNTGKGACILPLGVLFRGNAEATIRKELIKSGILKCIIGLPANLFYGTGIPACILVLNKENASQTKGIFIIDASKGFMKEGPKNRLREQDIHKITTTIYKLIEIPNYSRMVPINEIINQKNDYNLNIPRYIDNNEQEDIQDISGHIHGGIPEKDIDALNNYWKILPSLQKILFEPTGRDRYVKLKLPVDEVKKTIFSHVEFTKFNKITNTTFDDWKKDNISIMKSFDKKSKPKKLIKLLSESLLSSFKTISLMEPYNIYQHLLNYWDEVMQDDCYLISMNGWNDAVQLREILKVKNENGSLVWPKEEFDLQKGKRRFKSDLIPKNILVNHFFNNENENIKNYEIQLINIEQKIQEIIDENCGEEGLLSEVLEGEGDNQKLTIKNIKLRVKEIEEDADYEDEIKILKDYLKLFDKQTHIKSEIKKQKEELDNKLTSKYSNLTKDEIIFIVVENKWLKTLANNVQNEFTKISHTLTNRIHELAERYEHSLPHLQKKLATYSERVDKHIKKIQ
jgi:type I restriction enzyme M protein